MGWHGYRTGVEMRMVIELGWDGAGKRMEIR